MYRATLAGHVSPETAYTVADYPYGFRLRTSIRYWIETKPGYGQRFMSQTLNPKTGNWNKPKAGTYSTVMAMILDEQDHVAIETLTPGWDDEAVIVDFETRHAEAIGEYETKAIRYCRAQNAAAKHLHYTIRVNPGPRRSLSIGRPPYRPKSCISPPANARRKSWLTKLCRPMIRLATKASG